jgi:rhamnogalacturonyl hydrolase YesR
LGVEKSANAKGIALFLTGYCNLYKMQPDKNYLEKINDLAEKLLHLQNKNYSGSCWGYYFDWQARAFFQPANTPTVVATSFATDALLNAYDITGNPMYFDAAYSSTSFVLKDLNKTYDEKGNFSFSYSPLDHTQVFNASLLGARLLSRIYTYRNQPEFKEVAFKAVQFVCDRQQPSGAWSYGTLPFHQWIDNFHTGFNLECIYEYEKYTGDTSFREKIEKGFEYYINTFFCEDGAAKYYSNQLYPIDIHSPAQLIVTLARLNQFHQYQSLAEKVLYWTIENMQNSKGYFYYQKKKRFSSKISYMRWAQAWMFYSMSYYLLLKNYEQSHEQRHQFAGNTGL